MHQCRSCGYRFENENDLRRHEEEGRGCPEERRAAFIADAVARAKPLSQEDIEHIARLLAR